MRGFQRLGFPFEGFALKQGLHYFGVSKEPPVFRNLYVGFGVQSRLGCWGFVVVEGCRGLGFRVGV